MDDVTLYMILVFGTVLLFGVTVLILGLRQKDEDDSEGHDVPAE